MVSGLKVGAGVARKRFENVNSASTGRCASETLLRSKPGWRAGPVVAAVSVVACQPVLPAATSG